MQIPKPRDFQYVGVPDMALLTRFVFLSAYTRFEEAGAGEIRFPGIIIIAFFW